MSLPLLSADPGSRWTRIAEPWVVGPSFCPLDLVKRTILILELRYELRGQGILTENFSKLKSLPTVCLELLNLSLLGRRLMH